MRPDERRIREDARAYSEDAYRKANTFVVMLRDYRGRLTDQQIKTLRGQALSGDLEGAWKGLAKLTRG